VYDVHLPLVIDDVLVPKYAICFFRLHIHFLGTLIGCIIEA